MDTKNMDKYNTSSSNGIKNYGLGKYEEAVSNFQECLIAKSDDPATLNNIALCFEKLGKGQLAYEFNLRAIKLDPGNSKYLLDAGRMLQDSGQSDDAERLFREIIERTSSSDLRIRLLALEVQADTYANLGLLLESKGLVGEAIESLKRSIAVSPNQVDVYLILGRVYAESGDIENSIKSAKKAAELGSSDARSFLNQLGQ